MESVILAMVAEGISSSDFLDFARSYNIHNQPFITDVWQELVVREAIGIADSDPTTVDTADVLTGDVVPHPSYVLFYYTQY